MSSEEQNKKSSIKEIIFKEKLSDLFRKIFKKGKFAFQTNNFLSGFSLFDNEEENIDRNLICNIDPRSVIVEQYRNLRNQILSGNRDKKNKVLAVTSSVRGEGKTTIAGNLAISFATNPEVSVIIIDGDMRSPSMHKIFGISRESGLSEFINGDIEFEDSLKETFSDNIKIISAGEKASNPSELLSFPRMVKLIEDLRRDDNVNYVIIDTPPVIPATDPRVIAELADATIFVAKANHTSKELIAHSLSLLGKSCILGVVLNNMIGLSSYYPYYYPDVYGYGD